MYVVLRPFKGTESPDLASGVASCIVIRAPFGQFVSNQRLMIRGSRVVERTEACFVFLNPLSHGTISLHATLRH